MTRSVLLGLFALAIITPSGCSKGSAAANDSPAPRLAAAVSHKAATFPDAHEKPPAGWVGPVFSLRQDYPSTAPSKEALPWQTIDPKTHSLDYLNSVLAYALDGNVAVDWEVSKNKVRDWYHAPWMHFGDKGREFIHGLTRERTSPPKELHPNQTSRFQNWAVSVYNAPGGYVIGQVWPTMDVPVPAAALFPEGTVSIKLLFTQATVAEVPYLKDSFEWTANINVGTTTNRAPATVRLLQIDIAVRDSRVDSTTGWVFGTFSYDGNAPGATPWQRMVPVGLMWGNDPKRTPSNQATVPLMETFINPDVKTPQHLGWAGRLNGPVDNPDSSCLSCHAVGEYLMSSPLLPPAGSTETQRLNWFKNIGAGKPFTAGQVSQDYSLQLAGGLQNCLLASVCKPPTPAASAGVLAAGRGGGRSASLADLLKQQATTLRVIR